MDSGQTVERQRGRTEEEEAFYTRLHYLGGALFALGAGDRVIATLTALFKLTAAAKQASISVPADPTVLRRGTTRLD